jgi:thiol-disulfide isomerase/thioredoxin
MFLLVLSSRTGAIGVAIVLAFVLPTLSRGACAFLHHRHPAVAPTTLTSALRNVTQQQHRKLTITASSFRKRTNFFLKAIIAAIVLGAGFHRRRWPCTVLAFSPSTKYAYYATSRTFATSDYDTSSSHFPLAFSTETTVSSLSDDHDAATNTATPLPLSLPLPGDMKVNEIKQELNERNTSFNDCFDRESLEKRLIEAREDDNSGVLSQQSEKVDIYSKDESTRNQTALPDDEATTNSASTTATTTTRAESAEKEFDRDNILTRLRSLRVKELKIQLSELKVRWGTMIEKEELVLALCNALEERFHASQNFSRSGRLVPGTVLEVDESILLQELGWLESDVMRGVIPTQALQTSSPYPPILLDVYATWCGPCKFLAPILEKVAEEVGPTVRVMKLDSDKCPRLSSVLKGECIIFPFVSINLSSLRHQI